MAGGGASERWRSAMFENGNRIRFERAVDEAARQWWSEAFHGPHGLTPEGMGDLITRSVSGDKSIIYDFIDGEDHSFSLRVKGRFRDDGDVWFVERTLRLDGAVFSADEMFVPPGDAQIGRGRLLMRDLMEAAALLNVSRISVEAQKIGRYAWLRMGFVPDSGSWRNIQLDATRFIQSHLRHLGDQAAKLMPIVMTGKPLTARWLAALEHPVPSRELFDAFGEPVMVPLGKAFFIEAAPNWTGEFVFDPESARLARRYVEGSGNGDV